METIRKGREAEAAAALALLREGFEPYTAAFGNGICDIVALDSDGRIYRIEVKYTGAAIGRATWQVSLRQTRPNRTGVIHRHFGPVADVLAVYLAAHDTVQFYDAAGLAGRRSLNVKMEARPLRALFADA